MATPPATLFIIVIVVLYHFIYLAQCKSLYEGKFNIADVLIKQILFKKLYFKMVFKVLEMAQLIK